MKKTGKVDDQKMALKSNQLILVFELVTTFELN